MDEKKKQIHAFAARVIFVIAVLCIWEIVAKSGIMGDKSELIFPSLEVIGEAFVQNFTKGFAGTSLWIYIGNSMRLLLEGLLIGILLAFLLSGLSMVSRTFYRPFMRSATWSFRCVICCRVWRYCRLSLSFSA